MKNRKVLKNNGITLIALIVTIIVLLILAGVSIAMLTGENRNTFASTKSKRRNRRSTNRRRRSIRELWTIYKYIYRKNFRNNNRIWNDKYYYSR